MLPLSGDEKLAVIGQAAITPVFQGGGSSHINTTRVDAALHFMQERAEVQFAAGDVSVELNQGAIDEAVRVARRC